MEAERLGWTIAVFLPPVVPERVAEELYERITHLVHAQTGELHVVALPGDPLRLWTDPGQGQ